MQTNQVQIGNKTKFPHLPLNIHLQFRPNASHITSSILTPLLLPTDASFRRCSPVSAGGIEWHVFYYLNISPNKSFLWPLTHIQCCRAEGKGVPNYDCCCYVYRTYLNTHTHNHAKSFSLNAFNYLLQPLDEFLWPEHEPPTTFTICDILPRDLMASHIAS